MNKDNAYLYHIDQAIDKIERYLRHVNFSQFKKNDLVIDGVIRELAIIGEAANNLSEKFKAKNSEIPWRYIVDMRNFLIHEYFGVEPKIVWDTAKKDLAELKTALKPLLK